MLVYMEQLKTYYGENKGLVLGLVSIVAVIIIVIAGHAFFASDSSKTGDQPVVAQSEISAPAPKTYVKSEVKTVPEVPKISYADALVKYKDYRIQFDDKCNILTFKNVYKNNTEIMIDNRGSAKMFRVGDNQLSIAAYDFAIIKLQSGTLPEVIGVDCGSKQNVSEITIEK